MKKYFITNWKSYLTYSQTQALLARYADFEKQIYKKLSIVVCPSQPFLSSSAAVQKELRALFRIGAQNCYHERTGAYTGESTIDTLASIGITYCIVGHSERRTYFNETNADINNKIKALLEKKIVPIVCVGEDAGQRKNGASKRFVGAQLRACLKGVDVSKVLIAYEPLWAISGFKGSQAAKPEEVIDMHRYIKQKTSATTPVLYGGSVNQTTISDFAPLLEIDGLLVGSASTKYTSVKKMVDFYASI